MLKSCHAQELSCSRAVMLKSCHAPESWAKGRSFVNQSKQLNQKFCLKTEMLCEAIVMLSYGQAYRTSICWFSAAAVSPFYFRQKMAQEDAVCGEIRWAFSGRNLKGCMEKVARASNIKVGERKEKKAKRPKRHDKHITKWHHIIPVMHANESKREQYRTYFLMNESWETTVSS